MSAPASAKASRKGSTGEIIRWTSNGLARVRPKRLHHRRADGEVGHEMAVHDVDVDPVGAGLVDRADFLAELGEVGGQDRRGDERARPWRRLDGINRAADKARDEEAVEPALRLRAGRAGCGPSLRAMASRSRAARRARADRSRSRDCASRKAATTSSPSSRLERADRVDQRCRRASASRAARSSSLRLELGAVGDDRAGGRGRGLRGGGGRCRSPSRARRAGWRRTAGPAPSSARRPRRARPSDACGRDSRAVVSRRLRRRDRPR